ncbi:MAG: hypothetical protein VXX37_04100 [Pseudomonadota bacterium]|nr:hypothetical protein [Pseudomonadota bacterium]
MSDHNTAEATANKVVQEPSTAEKKQSPVGRLIFLLITGACFVYLYFRLNGAAARESMPLTEYMTQVFANVAWGPWLTLMVAYSLFYFLIDTLVVTRALNWLLADIKYKDILPIRASAYIISIFNEQIGKGAMAYYLNKRDQIPGWEVGSVMLFIMFCEIFYLLVWATVGYIFGGDGLPEVFQIMPVISIGATILLILWLLYFNGTLLPNNQLREKRILHGFRRAKLWHYGAFFLLRSPALLAAIVVYTTALNLFGVEASFLTLLPDLPVVFFAAAVPTPMRAAAITFWVILFPENEGQMAAFGFVQHNFFILFNAIIGLIFWRRAQRDLFA